MERKINRVCCVDGTRYTYCNVCGEDRNKPAWLASFCCENCRDIYNTVAAFNINSITANEAKDVLDKCDLSNKANFTPSTQRLIKEIYEEAEPISVENVEEKVEVKTEEKPNVQIQNKAFNKKKHR